MRNALSTLTPLAATLALCVSAPALAQADASPAGATPTVSSPVDSGALGSGISLPDLAGPLRQIDPPILLPGVRAEATLSSNLAHSGSGEGDLRIEVSPYIYASSNRPTAKYQLYYAMRNFLRVREGEGNFFRHSLNGTGSFALVSDNLWVDLTAFMGSVSANASGDLDADPIASLSNFGKYRRFSISPWYQDRLGSLATYNVRYYLGHTSGSSGIGLAKLDQRVSGSIDGIDRGFDWNWRMFGEFQRNEYQSGFERDRRHSGATLFYRYSHRLRLLGGIEYDQIDGVTNDEGDDFGWAPMLGFEWNPNSRLSVSANVADRYYGTTGSARVAWTAARHTLGLQYQRSILTSVEDSLLFLDPFAMTADPLGRTNAMLSSLLTRGILLPQGTILSPSFLTDAAVLDSRLTAYWRVGGASRGITLSAYVSNRETTTQLNDLLGGASSSIRGSVNPSGIFVGEVRDRGITLGYDQSLAARTRLSASIGRRYVDSPTADFENQLTSFHLGVVTSIDSSTTAFAGIRRNVQTTGGANTTATPYNENAIYGGVDVRFR